MLENLLKCVTYIRSTTYNSTDALYNSDAYDKPVIIFMLWPITNKWQILILYYFVQVNKTKQKNTF